MEKQTKETIRQMIARVNYHKGKIKTLAEVRKIIKKNRSNSICKLCRKVIKYKAWAWEHHMDEEHKEDNWRIKGSNYLPEKCFRFLDGEDMALFILKELNSLEQKT